MTELRIENVRLPGARLGEENPLPIFRDRTVNREVPLRESIPPEKRQYFGWQAGWRVLPYRLQDRYTRQREPMSLPAVVLENEWLAATFLPGLGGRMASLVYKPNDRELLFRNPVLQPANLALRDAWFAGGVEWNVGQYGHCFLTCSPVFAAAIPGLRGEPALRLYEFERCKGLFWQTDLYLPPGSPFLIASTRVANPQDEDSSMYWWTNIAVPETPDLRVLAPADTAIYADRGISGFGQAELPRLPSLDGRDGTYPLNSPYANEFFFQCEAADIPWIAALDQNGGGLIQASTPGLRYRKLFCWGTHQGGRHWQEFLSVRGQAYIEIQAGLAPTQLHGLPMAGNSEWQWTELFGYIEADPVQVHGDDWTRSWQAVDAALKRRLPVGELATLEEECKRLSDRPSRTIVHEGSGWGALELRRRARQGGLSAVPPAFLFPDSTVQAEQDQWLHLLEEGDLEAQDPADPPGAWMVQPEWRSLLASSLEHEGNRNWFALLHYGVMLAEAFEEERALAAWEESASREPSAWAYRNLGFLFHRLGRETDALGAYEQAWTIAVASSKLPESALAAEYLGLLRANGRYREGAAFYASLEAPAQANERVQVLRGWVALELGDFDTVEQVLHREFATIREGETNLTDLWFAMWAKRVPAPTGRPDDETLRRDLAARYPPPAAIDFRSHD